MPNVTWNFDTFFASVLGALIGGSLALAGAYLSHWLEVKRQNQKEAEHLIGLLQGFHDEVETIWESYHGSAGAQIEALPEGHPFLMYWPITQDYFTIYNTNAFFIGRIKDHDLRKAIIATYTKARGLIDSFRMNNDIVQKYEYAHLLFQETKNPVHQSNVNNYLQSLSRYAANLKRLHGELKVLSSDLLRRLRKQGVLNSKE